MTKKQISIYSFKYISKKNKKNNKQKTKKINKQKTKIHFNKPKPTIRIISVIYDEYKNDINVYLDIFKKIGFEIDVFIIDTIYNRKFINFEPNSYYDINLFLYVIDSSNDKYDFKKIFPASINIFAPNIKTFSEYKQLHYIDIVLCNTKICYNFINFIKKEHNYKFQSYYTNFTTIIPKQLLNLKIDKNSIIKNNIIDTFIFIHLAENKIFKNTASLIHCWLKYNYTFLDIIKKNNINSNSTNITLIELHISCNNKCFTNLLLEIKDKYNYDLLNEYKFEKYIKNKKKNINLENLNILKYKNLYLYLNILPKHKTYQNLIKKANVFICPSKRETYPHYINTARYFNKFVITMNSQPMNELINDVSNGNTNGNGYLLKNNFKKQKFKETKYIFIKIIIDIENLRDSIIWCIKNSKKIKYIFKNKSRIQFDNDKKNFESIMKSIMNKIKYNINNINNININSKYDMNKNELNTINTLIKKPLYKIFPESEQDNHCKYINVRGILNFCDIHSLSPLSSIRVLMGYDTDIDTINNMKEIKNIITIHVSSSAIPTFAEKSKFIKCKFILVSGDSDDTCPDNLFEYENDFKKFIENDNLIHWYSVNCILLSHPKLTAMPIGLAYHHVYNEDIPEEAKKIISPLKQEAFIEKTNKNIPFWEREIKCYINFNFKMNYIYSNFGYDRYEAITKIPNNLTFSEKEIVNRNDSWIKQSKYAFVVSPLGNGLDCHRTWEALILGCIPIVKTSGIDNLYKDLPVLIVDDWNDVTKELLENVVNDFKEKHEKGLYNYDKLLLKYWVDKINSHK
jgi:hypothetical protein